MTAVRRLRLVDAGTEPRSQPGARPRYQGLQAEQDSAADSPPGDNPYPLLQDRW